MDNPNRRNFLQDLGLGAAASSVTGEGEQSTTGGGRTPGTRMPGQPAAPDAEPQAAAPSTTMAIAAHPGDALFSMGAPVALQTHLGGKGLFVSLSLGEKGSASMPPDQYGPLQREAAERA